MLKIHKDDVKTVTTWNGREVPIDNCKRIGKQNPQYYEMGVDCFYVLNEKGEYKWTRLNSGKIAFNCETNNYDLVSRLTLNEELVSGIYNDKGDRGYFKYNPYKNVIISENLNDKSELGTLCVSAEIANKMGYNEYFATGCYVKKNSAALSKKAIYKYSGIGKLSYNADNNNKLFLEVVKEYNANKKHISYSENTHLASKLLPYSMGFELESSNGAIPRHLLGPLGVVPLKDGSLRKENGEEPYEFTTIPLEGALGLETIKLLSHELIKRCDFDEKCSLHIHLGGIKKRTESFVIAFYKLCFNLQEEVFSMFPAYKSNPEAYVPNFHKNYCQRLPDLGLKEFNFTAVKSNKDAKLLTKQAFDRIYYYMSDSSVPETNDVWNLQNTNHPKGQMDKWNYTSRYHWINLHPFLFSSKQTLEWRLHTPTFNHYKITNWLFICSAIMQFAEQFTNEILRDEVPYTLEYVLKCYANNFSKSFYETDYSQNVSNYLVDYVNFRKKEMKKCFENKDYYGPEFKDDSKFSFGSSGLNGLY